MLNCILPSIGPPALAISYAGQARKPLVRNAGYIATFLTPFGKLNSLTVVYRSPLK